MECKETMSLNRTLYPPPIEMDSAFTIVWFNHMLSEPPRPLPFTEPYTGMPVLRMEPFEVPDAMFENKKESACTTQGLQLTGLWVMFGCNHEPVYAANFA